MNVSDVNDHAPEFTRPTYLYRILENTTSDTSLDVVLALDSDIGMNAKVTYTIKEDLKGYYCNIVLI